MKIAFLGDLVIDNHLTVESELLYFLLQADRIIVNLEGILIEKGKIIAPKKSYGTVIFNDFDAVRNLFLAIGVTDVNVYNNHMDDYGNNGFNRTIDLLSSLNVNVIKAENNWLTSNGAVRLSNSGFAENFGFNKNSTRYGQNINDMLYERNGIERWQDSIINAHFGIEQVKGLSQYELNWFDYICHFKPSLVIRHHPHCAQAPFFMNGVPCFPSIGDFAFNFKTKKSSDGLVVVFDTLDSSIKCRQIKCKDYYLSMGESVKLSTQNKPERLSGSEYSELKVRYLREYREGALNSFKKSIKYFLNRENPDCVLSMSSSHFMQPFVLGEIL